MLQQRSVVTALALKGPNALSSPPSKTGFTSRALSSGAGAPLTEADVHECQAKWANAICTISKVFLEKGDFVAEAGKQAGELYGYGHTDVLFKPTKATNHPFRPTGEDAMSYFVGAVAMNNDKFYGEDLGFAIN